MCDKPCDKPCDKRDNMQHVLCDKCDKLKGLSQSLSQPGSLDFTAFLVVFVTSDKILYI